MRRALVLALLAAAVGAQGKGDREQNPTTLGLVVFERKGKVVVHAALEGSPAARAGMKRGDVLTAVGPRPVQRHTDIDIALRRWTKGRAVELDFRRGGKKRHLWMTPVPWAKLDHPWLRAASKQRTGFDAPAWHAFAWENVAKGAEPPTRANTRGKVVVIHCFHSW
ncbi:MAG: PDZ domain-containing protein [Planctomycetota bacterium]